MNQSSDDPAAVLRGNQILCAALIAGQVLFAAIIPVVHSLGEWRVTTLDAEVQSLFLIVGVVAGVVSVPVAVVLRRMIWAKGRSLSDREMLQAYLSGNLAFFAVLEGAGLLNLVFWLITATLVPYLVVTAVLIAIALPNFPRRSAS
ncbi:MAG: hypothetical protein ACYTGW_00195 [Planctomycetota bacterium]